MDRVRKYTAMQSVGRHLALPSSARAEAMGWCVALCFVLQLHLVGLPTDYVRTLFLLCGLGAIAAGALDTLPPIILPSITAVQERVRLHTPLVGAAAGLACAAIGAYRVATDPWNAQWWWLAGMAVALGSVLVPNERHWTLNRAWPPRINLWAVGLPIALFVTALIVRAVRIEDSPPFVMGDEGQCGLFGRLFNAGHTPLLSISWFGLPMFSYAVSGVGLRVFGDSLAGLRLINAVVGSLGVVLVYFLGKELFGRLPGVLAAVFLTFAFLHIEMSRDGIHYIQGPTCITLAMYLMARWLVRGGLVPALLSGMTLALSVQVYWSARIAAPLLAAVLVVAALRDRPLVVSRWREITWCAVGAVVAGLPVAALFRSQPDTFGGHQVAVSVIGNDPGTRAQILGEYGTLNLPVVLWHQAGRLLPTFNATPDATNMFGPWGGSMMDVVSAALLPTAVVLAVLRLRHWQYAVPLFWSAAVVVGGVFTLDPPNWPRTSALLPALTLMLGVLAAELWKTAGSFVRARWIAPAVMLATALWMAYANLDLVFRAFPEATLKTSMTATYVGQFLEHAPDARHGILLSDGSMYITYEAVQFLAPHASGCTLMPGQPLSTCPSFRSSRLFIALPGRVKDLAAIEHRRPGGKVLVVGQLGEAALPILAYEIPAKSGGPG